MKPDSTPRFAGVRFYGTSRPHFFEPADLRGEASDLGVEFFVAVADHLLAGGFAVSLKERRQTIKRGGFPGADLVRMNVVLGSDLGDALFFLEGLGDNLGFQSRCVTFSHGVLILTYFCRFSCLNLLGYYIEFTFRLIGSKIGVALQVNEIEKGFSKLLRRIIGKSVKVRSLI